MTITCQIEFREIFCLTIACRGMSDAALKYLVAERSQSTNAISQAEWAEKK